MSITRRLAGPHMPLGILAACVVIASIGCGGATTGSVAPSSSAGSPGSAQTTYTNDSPQYSIEYDSAVLTPTTAAMRESLSFLLPGAAETGLALMRPDADSTGEVQTLITASAPLGDYSYKDYVELLPKFFDFYAEYYKGKNLSNKVISTMKTVDGQKAFNYRVTSKLLGAGWTWQDATLVLTKQGWVYVIVFGPGKEPAPNAQPFLEAARSLSL